MAKREKKNKTTNQTMNSIGEVNANAAKKIHWKYYLKYLKEHGNTAVLFSQVSVVVVKMDNNNLFQSLEKILQSFLALSVCL